MLLVSRKIYILHKLLHVNLFHNVTEIKKIDLLENISISNMHLKEINYLWIY